MKSRMLKFRSVIILYGIIYLAGAVAVSASDKIGLGRVATSQEIRAWNIDVRPDGAGLPEGSGSVQKGEEVYLEKCASCHGEFGEAVGRWPALSGGEDTLGSDDPVKTVGSYWPYLSTVWDYINRAMPYGDAQSLTADEVYAITAYLLNMNDIVGDDFVLARTNFLDVKMPNREGFFLDNRDRSPIWKKRKYCMSDCKEKVTIISRARILDVTPTSNDEKQGQKAEVSGSDKEIAKLSVKPVTNHKLIKRGKKVFNRCKSCHAIGDKAKHRIGPHLNGIFNKLAGQQKGFKKYSKSMKDAGIAGLKWNTGNLQEFLKSPKKKIKKTKMAFVGLKKKADIEAVIAYMRSAGGE